MTRLDGCRHAVFILGLNLYPLCYEVVQALLHIEALDRGDIALGDIRDASEDVRVLIVEFAARVVMSAVDHHG